MSKYFFFLMMTLNANANELSPAGNIGEWIEIKPGGDTRCARGGEFSFFVRPGNSEKLLVNFQGGGACWDDKSCRPGSFVFVDSTAKTKQLLREKPIGIFDHHNNKNPFKDYTHVVIPNCTGDVHWGDAEKDYRYRGQDFTIHHKGAVNAQSVMEYIEEELWAANNVFVTGCSAGSYGSIYWLPKLKQIFPESQLKQFGDSGAGVIASSFQKDFMPNWNAESFSPYWVSGLDPERVDWSGLKISDFYKRIIDHYPNLLSSQYSHARDFIQTFFYKKSGGRALRWTRNMNTNFRTLERHSSRFSSFTSAGMGHCATKSPKFYNIKNRGQYLYKWLQDFVDKKDPKPQYH